MNFSKTEKRHILILLFLVPFLLGMTVDLYVPSLPAITAYYGVSESSTQLTISFYMFGYALGQLLIGFFSEGFARRKILLTTGFLFTLCSYLVIYSPCIKVLILCRFLQGVTIAGLATIVRALAVDVFEGVAFQRAITHVTTSWALGPIIGPAIGGYLQHYFNWQAGFYFFTIYGVFIFIYILFFIPETQKKNVHIKNPLEILQIFKQILLNSFFIFGAVTCSLLYAALVVFNTIGPFLVEESLRYSVVDYGHIALLLGFANFLGNISNQFLIGRFCGMKVFLFSVISAFVLSAAMFFMGYFAKPSLLILIIPAWFLFFFQGLAFPNMAVRITRHFSEFAGVFSALFGFFVAGGVFLVTALVSGFKFSSQVPMAFIYIVIFAIVMLLFWGVKEINNKKIYART